MKETLLHSALTPVVHSSHEVFYCPEESEFYSLCLERFVLNNRLPPKSVVEFGAGDGSPVINALLRTQFNGSIHGYELNRAACQVARARIEQYQLGKKYSIHDRSFFESSHPESEYLIANPPYLPAPDSDICLPLLHGGIDGTTITKQLLSLGYERTLLMISSYSNPIELINYAIKQNYRVTNFMVLPLEFGYYSSEAKVKNSIEQLRKHGKAFYSDKVYFLAGVGFSKLHHSDPDLSNELIQVMMSSSQ